MSSLRQGRDQPWNSGRSHCSSVLPPVGPRGCVGFLLLTELNLCPKKGEELGNLQLGICALVMDAALWKQELVGKEPVQSMN